MTALRHPWPTTTQEAIALQGRLRARVSVRRFTGRVRTVAGVDVSYTRGDTRGYGGVVVLTFPQLKPVEEAGARVRMPFPYIPGLLSFRELPVVLEACARLRTLPDLIICDGQGIAHPRGLGIASHLGLWLDRPTVGCAKSRLVGDADAPGPEPGDAAMLRYDGKRVGYLVRTRRNVKPVYVSPGHRVSAAQARDFVLRCTRGYRLPETTRRAHALVNRLRRADQGLR